MPTLDVVVVVVTYNSAGQVDGLLDGLPAAMGELSYRVVCVDNASADDTVIRLAGRPEVTLVQQSNLGYAAGINTGAAEVPDSETVLALNPDVRLAPGAVATMMATMRETGAGIVAPRMLFGNRELALTLRREPTLLRAAGLSRTGHPLLSEAVQQRERYETRQEVAWAVGAVLLVSREVHEALHGWDESFFLYSEETDLCLRARDRGWRTVYEPRAEAIHFGGGSGRNGRTEAMQTVNRLRLFARRRGRVAALAYFVLLVLSEVRDTVRGSKEARACLVALLLPARRPPEIGAGHRLIPT